MIERDFDIAFISDLARREKQIQQNYRPIIAVHKWFARRPGTLFRGLILSEFSKEPLRDAFYRGNDLSGFHIADPFMGGGTPLIEANRMGCDVTGIDVNPMAYWIVKEELEHLDLQAYAGNAAALRGALEKEIGDLYRTRCCACGDDNAHVKYFLWVKVQSCVNCKRDIDLFPGYLVATDSRHPKNVLVCSSCGELSETTDRGKPGKCGHCDTPLTSGAPAQRNRCACSHCDAENRYPNPDLGAPRHRMFAIEYHCLRCKPTHEGRFFKKPDARDQCNYRNAETRIEKMRFNYVPTDDIPDGDESSRLHRWGYSKYRELFNARQLLGLELSARLIAKTVDQRVRNALATNLSDLLRYQNMLCRYDTQALKSLDIFSVHGFPVGLVQCESNILGIGDPLRKTSIGSGGWANIIDKYRKAKSYCDEPFEIRQNGKAKKIVTIDGEWIGEYRGGDRKTSPRSISIACSDSATMDILDNSLDAVFTDPPYFGNVQYAELMDFCYVWLRKLVGKDYAAFNAPSTRTPDELTGNASMGRDLAHFTEGISLVFQRASRALKNGAPLSFTYHHNSMEAYFPIAVAILDAGLTCSASLPCPAEMGASIHIMNTGSSIIDTVFVCRTTGSMRRSWLADTIVEVSAVVQRDLDSLKAGNVNVTAGDIRCVTYGHLIRLAIWNLREGWDKHQATAIRIARVEKWLREFGSWKDVEAQLVAGPHAEQGLQTTFKAWEENEDYGADTAFVSF
ncbi:MAG: DNA methylase [Candidatus Hydrogenedentes bacterium]|nr:DNA methylase [Candidatus Hydrogenedentota bacterium]